jgi:multicomponent Na+:H+ antiporter subunit E
MDILNKEKAGGRTGRRVKWTVIAMEFITLYIFWILLSGRFQIKYLIIGAFAAGIVTYFTNDLIYSFSLKKGIISTVPEIYSAAIRLPGYALWLVWAIVKANIQIALIILNPKMPINPDILEFKTRLRKKVSLVTLGNSITLTPGTVTIDMGNDVYTVHSLLPLSAGDLESGLMQNKVGSVFGDFLDPAPSCKWSHCSGELRRVQEIER